MTEPVTQRAKSHSSAVTGHDLAGLVARFGLQPPAAPAVQPWGAKVGFLHDPCGVLWHVSEH